jgi:hypothetical protein
VEYILQRRIRHTSKLSECGEAAKLQLGPSHR